MVVANQCQRRQALSLGNVVGKKDVADKTVDDLRKEWESGKSDLLENVRYYGKSIDGSPNYFHQSSTKALALMRHVRFRSGDSEAFNVFATFSAADMHWDDLHRLFPESKAYIDKIVSC